MKFLREKIRDNWYIYFCGGLLLIQAAVFLIFRGESYIQVHDNLDLFMAHYKVLTDRGLWFKHGVDAPILHGVSRDLFGSEFSLYNALYYIFPGIWAYLLGYALKIAIGMFSFILLSKDVLKERYEEVKPAVILCACAFGMIPVFPTYGIAFTSVPFIILLLRKLYNAEKGNNKALLPLYIGIFCYPLLSYFAYHGFFILGYMVLTVIILWIKDKKFPRRIFAALVILALGYVCFEYRLFKEMLFSSDVTIRTSMEHAAVSFAEVLKLSIDEFLVASFHNQDSHTYVVLPVVLIGTLVINASYIKNKKAGEIKKEPLNLIMLWIIFNVIIYGLYQYEPFWRTFETLVPQLKGFIFSRTVFFNPLLWYTALLFVLIWMYGTGKKAVRCLANILAMAAVIVVMFLPQVYNDFYYTIYNQAYKIIKQKDTYYLNYNEFYSTKLFDKIKSDIGYDDEWAAAYGMHPAVLDYNGIATVDGYLGMYSQEYKEKWEKVIAPALAGSPYFENYFMNWGARVCLYSGSDENTYAHTRNVRFEDHRLMADIAELKKLDCKYIFSRIEFTNGEELGLAKPRVYEDESSPYTIYVYEL